MTNSCGRSQYGPTYYNNNDNDDQVVIRLVGCSKRSPTERKLKKETKKGEQASSAQEEW